MADTDSKYAESFISQDELDSLLKEAEDLGPEAFDMDSSENSDGNDSTDDVIDQDDIDKLLNSSGSDDAEDDSEEPELVSQEDIDALLDGARTPEPDASDKGDLSSDLDLITQDDITALLSGTELNGEDPGTPVAEDRDDDDDSLISQDDINALLAGNGADDPVAEQPDDDDSLISQDDIDRLLAGGDDSAVDEPAADDESENLISQDDIDKLLQEETQEEDSEVETLISQDDIDKLLMSSGPDETSAPESVGVEEEEKLVSQDDIDRLLNADIEELDSFKDDFQEESDADQVILEKSDEPEDDESSGSKPKWYKSRIVLSCAAALIVFIIAGVTWGVLSGGKDNETQTVHVTETTDEPDVVVTEPDIAETDPEEYSESAESVSVVMDGFVVPAPASVKGVAYISVNITLEIVDVTSDPIKDYEPFFRNIVYEVLNKALILQTEAKIVEADLKKMITEALNDALSEGSVSFIEFSEFKLG